MNLAELQQRIDFYLDQLSAEARAELGRRLAELDHAYPFSAFEYTLMYLQHAGALSFNSYEDLREIYVTANPYLHLFERDPRQFGQDWGANHLIKLHPDFARPNLVLDPDFDGQYDLWLDGTKVGVRSARAIDSDAEGSLVAKALRHATDKPFWMNFSQLQLDACDVFVFIGVWVDCLVYWVCSSEEARNNKYLSHQRRGGIDYQISIQATYLDDLNPYLTPASEIAAHVSQLGRTE